MKSMRGEALDAARLGWHGLDGDRRFAVRRLAVGGPMPWLTASRLPELIHFAPCGRDDRGGEPLPTHVRTPEGDEWPLLGEALAAELGRRHGAPVEVMHLGHGIFDETSVSVITSDTSRALCRLAGVEPDVRRFRPNIVVRAERAVPLEEDDWVGGVLTFGEAADAPAVTVTMRDLRCVMVNLDPDGGPPAPAMMKAVVRANANHAGVYGTVTRTGALAVGQPIVLHRP
ncbi:MAG: MOSC domain-containing protein [Myxococcales bacterium]|nr:MOSC domain-containing protein [Myxococcales bacterium]